MRTRTLRNITGVERFWGRDFAFHLRLDLRTKRQIDDGFITYQFPFINSNHQTLKIQQKKID